MRIAQHLDFDVVRLFDEFFDEDPIVAEAGLGLRLARVEALARFAIVARHAQALAASTGGRLDHDGIAHLLRDAHGSGRVGNDIGVSGDRIDVRFRRQLLRRDLVAHRGNRLMLRSDEDDPGRFQLARERFVLGQEAIAWMDRFRAGGLARGDDLVHPEIRVARRRGADAQRLVGQLDVPRVAIGFRVDGHRGDPHRAGSANDAAGDFAAIGDQDFLEHGDDLQPFQLRTDPLTLTLSPKWGEGTLHISPARQGTLPLPLGGRGLG